MAYLSMKINASIFYFYTFQFIQTPATVTCVTMKGRQLLLSRGALSVMSLSVQRVSRHTDRFPPLVTMMCLTCLKRSRSRGNERSHVASTMQSLSSSTVKIVRRHCVSSAVSCTTENVSRLCLWNPCCQK